MNTRDLPKLWQQLTLRGNALFDSGEHARAAALYEEARTLALDRFDQWDDSADAIAAVVVSYLNLSEAQARGGALDEGCASLCTIHASLLRARDNEGLHESLREAAARHLRETFAALVRYRETWGDRPELHHLLCPDCGRWPGGRRPASATLH